MLVWRQHNNSQAEDKPVKRMTLKNRWKAALCSHLCYRKSKVILPSSVQEMINKTSGFKEISMLSFHKTKKSMKWSLCLNSKLRSMIYSYLLLVWTLGWSSNLEKFSGDFFCLLFLCTLIIASCPPKMSYPKKYIYRTSNSSEPIITPVMNTYICIFRDE